VLGYRDDAYEDIIAKHCELGSLDSAVDIATRIDHRWTELDVFQLIGKTLAKSRSIAELESFLTAQRKPTRLSAAYLGVLEVLVTDAEPNDRSKTDGDSAAPLPPHEGRQDDCQCIPSGGQATPFSLSRVCAGEIFLRAIPRPLHVPRPIAYRVPRSTFTALTRYRPSVIRRAFRCHLLGNRPSLGRSLTASPFLFVRAYW